MTLEKPRDRPALKYGYLPDRAVSGVRRDSGGRKSTVVKIEGALIGLPRANAAIPTTQRIPNSPLTEAGAASVEASKGSAGRWRPADIEGASTFERSPFDGQVAVEVNASSSGDVLVAEA